MHNITNLNKDILTTYTIPISLWKQNTVHLFHKNTQIIIDKKGKQLCVKCIIDTFINEKKSSIYLSQICEDLLLLLKCEKEKKVIRYITNEMLNNDCDFIIKEINKTNDDILLNNLINLMITLLNKHFSIAENNQRLQVCENMLKLLINKIMENNLTLKSLSKLIFIMLDDRLSVYSNLIMETIIEDNNKLINFGNIILKIDGNNVKYIIPTVIKLIEYKPERVLKEIVINKGLLLSKLFYELSEDILNFNYILEFYIYILINFKEYFGDLIRENKELTYNILNGIEKIKLLLSKSNKYLIFNNITDNLNIDNEEDYKLIKKLIQFFKEFILFKKEEKLNKLYVKCTWTMENEYLDIIHKIIEWMVELLKNNINIELENLTLECIIDIFTSNNCKINDLLFNENEAEENSKFEYEKKDKQNKNDEPIDNLKVLNIKSKRVTFKRMRNEEINFINQDEKCFHQIFIEKHGRYLIDIFLELFDDYLHKFDFINIKDNNRIKYDEHYQYIIDNEEKIRNILFKILKGMINISESITVQSCPRQIYALCWFIQYIINNNDQDNPPIPLFGSSSMDMIMQTINTDEPLEKALINIRKFNQNNTKDIKFSKKNISDIQLLLCNQIVSLIDELSMCLKKKINHNYDLDTYNININQLWKLNGTVYNRELLLEYFSYIITMINKLNEILNINIIQILQATNRLFEFYSTELKSKEYCIISLCQLNIIQEFINNSLILEKLQYEECEDRIKNTKNDIFSLILTIDKRIYHYLLKEDGKDDIYDILMESKKKIESFIYNKLGAQIILIWLQDPKQNNIHGINNHVLYRWISYIVKHLVEPLLNEKEINNRIKYISTNKIKSSLLLDESLSNDTISIIISLLYFCYNFYPNEVYLFIIDNIKDKILMIKDKEFEESKQSYENNCIVKFDYINKNIHSSINNDNYNSCIGHIPSRIILYYSFVLLNKINILEKYDINSNNYYYYYQDFQNYYEKQILTLMINCLVNTSIRKREWLLWHSKQFDKSNIFSESLKLLVQGTSQIKNYYLQKNIEESLYKWIYERIVDYNRYQVSIISSNFYMSPIIEKSLINNISFIKYEIKQLIQISSIKLNNETKYEEYIQKLNIHINLFIYSFRYYLENNNDIQDQLTIEEIILPFKLLLNNKDEYDLYIKNILTKLYLEFTQIFFSYANILFINNNIFYIIIKFIDDLTIWIDNIYNKQNINNLNLKNYLEIIISSLLEYETKDNSQVNDDNNNKMIELKQLFLDILQENSTISLYEKITNYIIECHRKNNKIEVNEISHLFILSVTLFSLFLNNIHLLKNNGIMKFIKLVLKHPTFLLHGDDIKCNNDENCNYCDYCVNYGLNHINKNIKIITLISLIVLFINNKNKNNHITSNIYMHCIINIIDKDNRDKYSILIQSYLNIILIILYLYENKSFSISLIHNLYIQKYLINEFISDIIDLNIDNIEISLSYYSASFLYIIFVINSSPWWFNISELMNLSIINKIGKIYKTLLTNNSISYETRKYALIVTQVLLKSIIKVLNDNIQYDILKGEESNNIDVKNDLILIDNLKNQDKKTNNVIDHDSEYVVKSLKLCINRLFKKILE